MRCLLGCWLDSFDRRVSVMAPSTAIPSRSHSGSNGAITSGMREGSYKSGKLSVTSLIKLGLCLVMRFFFFFFFFCVPQLYLWGSPLLGEIFAYVTVFFNPTIKVVTFRLRGWCVLGVFLLPAFTRLGHERQDLLSPCDEMHACTD